ncbi:cysteine hydrolase [Mycobacterium frederiksbergense]|uniref:cysteine hydrolase family protein n=1 Tax=Mycolicibacterium frederiksbergense TaxID=117567 RepID=UPI0021F2CA25|nr:isochorismatase family cysteine hydrolase [Mycolicibacterium frederiksbergense]MCV7043303.1 cysteine hydrolase [Mycolicibacterium frederiksbergense]
MARLSDRDRHAPDRAALVVVDVQNDFCSPTGSLPAGYQFDLQHVDAMVPRLLGLIDTARRTGLPVIFVRTEHDPSNDTAAWLGRLGDDGGRRAGVTCRTGSWGAEFFGVAPEPGDHVVTKNRFSAFVGTNLAIMLRSLGVDSALFTGVATEVCVESSLRDAVFHDFYVTLVQDCSASYSRAAHDASVHVVGKHFGLVTTADQLIAEWTEARQTEEVGVGSQ